MQNSYLEHPPEETLERFLLNQSQEEELEVVETHILACESCVSKLEALEIQIGAMKLALAELQGKQRAKEIAKARNPWKNWFTVPKLSWASATAVLALALFVFVPRNVDLTSYRGSGNVIVPAGHPLRLHLNANDLPEGPVTVEIVDATGTQIWKGAAAIRHDRVDVAVPSIREHGSHFLRLYAPARGNSEGGLLREFAFKTK